MDTSLVRTSLRMTRGSGASSPSTNPRSSAVKKLSPSGTPTAGHAPSSGYGRGAVVRRGPKTRCSTGRGRRSARSPAVRPRRALGSRSRWATSMWLKPPLAPRCSSRFVASNGARPRRSRRRLPFYIRDPRRPTRPRPRDSPARADLKEPLRLGTAPVRRHLDTAVGGLEHQASQPKPQPLRKRSARRANRAENRVHPRLGSRPASARAMVATRRRRARSFVTWLRPSSSVGDANAAWRT